MGSPIRLRELHPNLWRTTIGSAIIHVGIGLCYLLMQIPAHPSVAARLPDPLAFMGPAVHIMPLEAWGIFSLCVGLLGLSGLVVNFATHTKLVAVYHAFGLGLASCWTLSAFYALSAGDLGSVALPWLWGLLAGMHILMVREPSSNPANWSESGVRRAARYRG